MARRLPVPTFVRWPVVRTVCPPAPPDYHVYFGFNDGSGNAVGIGPGAVTLPGKDIHPGIARCGLGGAATTYPPGVPGPTPDDSGFNTQHGALPWITLGTAGWTIAFWSYEHAPAPVVTGGPHDGNQQNRTLVHQGTPNGQKPFGIFQGHASTFVNLTLYKWHALDWNALATGWHHVAVVGHPTGGLQLDGHTELYLDGVSQGDATNTDFGPPFTDVATASLISLLNVSLDLAATPGQLWGAVDELYVYLRELAPAEIATMAGV